MSEAPTPLSETPLSETPLSETPASETPASPAPGSPSPEELKLAFKAFKKRLKLTRLDAESKIGVGPMSNGANWGIVAIMPPNQYPRAVWDELVKQGKLKNAGHGLYSIVAQGN